MTLSDDLMAPEVVHDPHSYYRGLRAESPVHWNDRWGGWVVTRYDDVVKVLRNAKSFSADRMAFLFQGRVRANGTPDEIRATEDEVVRQFVSGRAHGPISG